MVGQISTCLAEAKLNIADLLNKSRGDLAYTLIDTDAPIPPEVLERLRAHRRRAAARGWSERGAQGRQGREAKARGKSARRAGRSAGRGAASRWAIEKMRALIDSVDARIHELISERARLAQQVGISKHAAGHTVDFYRPEREAQVLRMAVERNRKARGPLPDEEIVRLFREIMSACLAQQESLKVAFLGPEGTFTQQAVLKHFGHSVRALPLTSIEEVFREVESGTADFGVVPIENSSEGTVNNTLDMFLTSPLGVCGEVELRVHQNLMGRMASLADVQRICAHPQALAQCRGWLAEHLQGVETPAGREQRGRRASRAGRGRHGGHCERRGGRRLRPQHARSRRSRTGRTTRRASWSSAAGPSRRAARTRPRCSCRRPTPTRRARCSACSSRSPATGSA